MTAWRYEISLLVLKNIFQHSKRNFVSPRGHVISSMSNSRFQILMNVHMAWTIVMLMGSVLTLMDPSTAHV